MASLRLSQPHLHQTAPQPARAHHQPSAYSGVPQPQAQTQAQIPAQTPPAPGPVLVQMHSHRPSGTAAPLTAPQPVRAVVPPPSVPTPGMWSPEIGIRFDSAGVPPGANAGPATSAARGQPTTWDPSQGVRFS